MHSQTNTEYYATADEIAFCQLRSPLSLMKNKKIPRTAKRNLRALGFKLHDQMRIKQAKAF